MSLLIQYLDNLIKLISNFSGCQCVGIRILKKDETIPYESYVGYSREFLDLEKCLSIYEDECVCARVFTGKLKPYDASCITPFGSFRSGHTKQFIDSLSEKERANFRGICVQHGFNSLAIIPIRCENKTIGAIHLADKREAYVPLDTIEFIESLTSIISEAMRKFEIEDEIRKSYNAQNVVNSLLSLSLEGMGLEEILGRGIEMILASAGFEFCGQGAIFLVENEPEVLVLKAHRGLAENVKKGCNRVAFGQCLCGKAALKRKLRFMNKFDCEHEKKYEGILPHSHYCVPIVLGNKTLGLINIYFKPGQSRDPTTEIFLTTVANSLAVIIQRKQIEQELYESNKLLRTVLSNTHFLIVYLGVNFNFICVNSAYAQANHKDVDFFTGLNYFDLYPDAHKKQIFERVLSTCETYYANAEPLNFAANPVNVITYWDWSLRPIKEADGNVEGLLLCFANVTEHKWTHDELMRAQKELADAKRLSDIGILAATIAHELRNPLGVIRTAAYNLKRKTQNPLLESHFINIEKKVLESDQIINNLLFYSRIKTPQYENVHIYDLLEECVKNFKKRYNKWKVKLLRKYRGIKENFVEIDPLQIKEVFNNMLNNAYESLADNKGEIEIRAISDSKSNQIKISFKDTGIGIAQEDLVKLPQMFFTRKTKGTGLGLSVSYQIVKLHGGKIEVESSIGKGTKFTVILPVVRA